ncbi:hypothetical protein KCU65_g5840, partial [Aureobasidium melanogenum]
MSSTVWSQLINRIVEWINDGQFSEAERFLRLFLCLSRSPPPYYHVRFVILLGHCVDDRETAKHLAWSADSRLHDMFLKWPVETTTPSGRQVMDKLLRMLDDLDEKIFADQLVDDDYPGLLLETPVKLAEGDKETAAKVEEGVPLTKDVRVPGQHKKFSQNVEEQSQDAKSQQHSDSQSRVGKQTALTKLKQMEREQGDDDFTFFLPEKSIYYDSDKKITYTKYKQPPVELGQVSKQAKICTSDNTSPSNPVIYSSARSQEEVAELGNIPEEINVSIQEPPPFRVRSSILPLHNCDEDSPGGGGECIICGNIGFYNVRRARTARDTAEAARREHEMTGEFAPQDATAENEQAATMAGTRWKRTILDPHAFSESRKNQLASGDVPNEGHSANDASAGEPKKMNIAEELNMTSSGESPQSESSSPKKTMAPASTKSSSPRPASSNHPASAHQQADNVSAQAESTPSRSQPKPGMAQSGIARSHGTPLLSTSQNVRPIQKDGQTAAQEFSRSSLMGKAKDTVNRVRNTLTSSTSNIISTIGRTLTHRIKRRPESTAGSVVGEGQGGSTAGRDK